MPLVQFAQGAQLGSYVLERKLGVGAFGVVWLARHQGGRQVAIKVLHPAAASSHESVERFRREAYVLSQMKSPHIAEMYEFLNLPPWGLVLVMEFVDGELLSEKLKTVRFSIEHTIYLGVDLLRGITEMHKHGIIHRDIKPENVILRPAEDGRWRAVIFDFNLSRLKGNTSKAPGAPGASGPQGSLTAMGSAIGTVPYMAPEQLLDARRVAEAADLYSVGAILYRAAAGAPPFEGAAGLREKLLKEAPPMVQERTDPVAIGFERVVMRAIKRRPQDRFANGAEMGAALEGVLARMSRPFI
jgi:serine/threonine protein kinase